MAMNSKSNRPQKSRSSDKSAANSKASKDNDYPNIIEEPIRIVGDRGKSGAGKSGKQSAKGSGKTAAKKSGKKKRS
jgi:hypothetical protein